jgi:drug/metabolite transporter (DMT)-like permease
VGNITRPFEWTFGNSIAIYFVLLMLLFVTALSHLGLAAATMIFSVLFFVCASGTFCILYKETRCRRT